MTKLTILTTLILTSCSGYDITKNTPHFLDTKKGYARVYEAKKIEPQACGEPDYIFKYTGQTKPISEMNGYVCLPTDQVQYNLRFYNEYLKRKANCN
jgi:hypothetical protein